MPLLIRVLITENNLWLWKCIGMPQTGSVHYDIAMHSLYILWQKFYAFPFREPRFYFDRHIIFLRSLRSGPFFWTLPSPISPESTSIKPNFSRREIKMKSRNECLIIESIMDPIMVYGLILGVGWACCKECGTKFISMVIIFQTRCKAEGTHFFHHLPSL